MEMIPTEIPEVRRVVVPRFVDRRGDFSETFRAEWFDGFEFVQDNHSRSIMAGTVRGLHFQVPPRASDKLVRVSRGSALDVAVDLRIGSPTFGRHVAFVLSADGGEQLLVPRGFAHGFVTLEPDTEVVYKVTDYHSAEHDKGLLWNDPALGIDWGVEPGHATVSERDRSHLPLDRLAEYFRF
jgi:dTDP-4-dehydrorhamnose 3,5-epimerase